MFPRRDGILLGGTFERNQWDLTPDREAEKRVYRSASAHFRPTINVIVADLLEPQNVAHISISYNLSCQG